jgi:carnitine 3-dehydrogenase
VLADYDRTLFAAGNGRPTVDEGEPLRLHAAEVPPEWVDYNGHVHESRYLQLFGDATDALLRYLGIDAAYLAAGGSYFTVETHLCHLGQLEAGHRVHVTSQVLGADEKRLHVFHSLYRDGHDDPAATAEQMFLHVDTSEGRAAPVRNGVREAVERLAAAHESLPAPSRAGRAITLPRPAARG